jgi:hypothetical protein
MSEENKALVRWEMEELFNHTGNLDVVEEIIAPNYVSHEPTSGETRGIEGTKQFAATYVCLHRKTAADNTVQTSASLVSLRCRGVGESDGWSV